MIKLVKYQNFMQGKNPQIYVRLSRPYKPVPKYVSIPSYYWETRQRSDTPKTRHTMKKSHN